jgi:diacylglycerol kinase family enzyme
MDFSGFDVVVGVGGDGTFHECINGMMKRSAAKGKQPAPLALIAAGTGNSFMHELRCFKLKSAVYHILRGVNYPIDICRLTFGDGSTCYSFNSIHWGIASKIMLTAERLRWMGSAMRYTTACFMEIVGGEKAQLAKVVVTDENDREVEYNDKFIVAIANNIITASRGMKMAPEAKIDDGLVTRLLQLNLYSNLASPDSHFYANRLICCSSRRRRRSTCSTSSGGPTTARTRTCPTSSTRR